MADDQGDENIPDTGAVFTFGKSRFADNEPNRFWIRDDPVAAIACGDEHTAFITQSGRLFTFGVNGFGQLGHGNTKTYTKPSCVKVLKGRPASLVACGKCHTLVKTADNVIFAFGCNTDRQCVFDETDEILHPVQVDSLQGQDIKQLSAGAQFSASLGEGGEVFVWGHLSESRMYTTPTRLNFGLTLQPTCVQISCGYYHMAFLDDSGKIHMQHDPGIETERDEVSTIDDVATEKFKQVQCGGKHTVALSESGAVFTWGQGSEGQLGQGSQCLALASPRQLQKLAEVKFIAIQCGESHTALISDAKQLYMFGDCRHGKLCLDDQQGFKFTPVRSQRFAHFDILNVACGGCHTIVVAQPTVQWEQREEQLRRMSRRLKFEDESPQRSDDNNNSDDANEDTLGRNSADADSQTLTQKLNDSRNGDLFSNFLNNSFNSDKSVLSARERRRLKDKELHDQLSGRPLPSAPIIDRLPTVGSSLPPLTAIQRDLRTLNQQASPPPPAYSKLNGDSDHEGSQAAPSKPAITTKEMLANKIQDITKSKQQTAGVSLADEAFEKASDDDPKNVAPFSRLFGAPGLASQRRDSDPPAAITVSATNYKTVQPKALNVKSTQHVDGGKDSAEDERSHESHDSGKEEEDEDENSTSDLNKETFSKYSLDTKGKQQVTEDQADTGDEAEKKRSVQFENMVTANDATAEDSRSTKACETAKGCEQTARKKLPWSDWKPFARKAKKPAEEAANNRTDVVGDENKEQQQPMQNGNPEEAVAATEERKAFTSKIKTCDIL